MKTMLDALRVAGVIVVLLVCIGPALIAALVIDPVINSINHKLGKEIRHHV